LKKNIRNGRPTAISTYADASNMVFYKKVLGNVAVTNGYFNAGIGIKKSMSQGNPMTVAKQNQNPIQAISTSLFKYFLWIRHVYNSHFNRINNSVGNTNGYWNFIWFEERRQKN